MLLASNPPKFSLTLDEGKGARTWNCIHSWQVSQVKNAKLIHISSFPCPVRIDLLLLYLVQAALLLSQISPEIVGDPIVANRLYDAVNVILSLMVSWSEIRFKCFLDS